MADPLTTMNAAGAFIREAVDRCNEEGWEIKVPHIVRPQVEVTRIGNQLRIAMWIPLIDNDD